MSKILTHEPVKLIIGFISGEKALFDRAEKLLSKKFGPVDKKSGIFNFDHTAYYRDEFGDGLLRIFISFRNLINPEAAFKAKLFTNRLEKVFAAPSRKRRINIDPGYLDHGKLVLFTTKNYSHRIYIKNGIYAEVTLHYKDGTFKPWEWTYPDYKTKGYLDFFNETRTIYKQQLTKNDADKKKK